jgi:hypothetical protein
VVLPEPGSSHLRVGDGFQERGPLPALSPGQPCQESALTSLAFLPHRGQHVQVDIHVRQRHGGLGPSLEKAGVDGAERQATAFGGQGAEVGLQERFWRHLVGGQTDVLIPQDDLPLVPPDEIAVADFYVLGDKRATRRVYQGADAGLKLGRFLVGQFVSQQAAQGLQFGQLPAQFGQLYLNRGVIGSHRLPPQGRSPCGRPDR